MVPKKAGNEIALRVGELTDRSESGRGIVRIDSGSMKELEVREGDVVELKGQRNTGAIAVRAYPADVGLSLVRMDGISRRNAGIGVGETVKIKRVEVKEAKRVVLAPAQKGIMLQVPPEMLKNNILFRPVKKGDMLSPMPVVKQRGQDEFEDIFSSMFGGMGMSGFSPMGQLRLMVVSTNPDEITRIGEATEIEVRPEAVEIQEKAISAITYEDIGGLHESIDKIREMVELPLRHPELFEKIGIQPPKGVLLYGPPGSGKTLLAKAVSNESGANFSLINGPEVMSRWYGGSEENLRKIFEDAEKNAPAIIFIDEIDAIAPKREDVTGEVERRVVSQLLCLHPETKVYLPDKFIDIKNLYEKSSGKSIKDDNNVEHKIPGKEIYVQALDNSGKISKARVIAMSKTPIKKGYKISLANGGNITSSQITRFLTISNDGIKWRHAHELSEGDYILIPRKLEFLEKIEKIDVFKLQEKDKWIIKTGNPVLAGFFRRKYIKLSEIKSLLEHRKIPVKGMSERVLNYLLSKGEDSKEQIESSLGISRRSLNNCIRNLKMRGVIEAGKTIKAKEITRQQIVNSIEGLAHKDDKRIYPLKEKYFIKLPKFLDESLAKFLSLVITEGHINNRGVRLSGETSWMVERIGEEIFGLKSKVDKYRKDLRTIELNSRALSEFLNDYFKIPKGKKSYIVKIPKQIFTSPKSVKSSFLAGLIEGDGSIYRSSVRFYTASKGMAEDVTRLFASLGIQSVLKNYNVYTVKVTGGFESFKTLSDSISSFIELEKKKATLSELTKKIKKYSSVVYPVKDMLRDIREQYNLRIDDNKYRYLSPNLTYQINSNVLGYFIQKMEGIENTLVEELRQVQKSEVIPCMITGVETVETEQMYDLTTEYSNFIAGDIPVVVHNTLMDGLKSRGKVIVIAATNRENSIDPALRRPGRFDREVEIGVPDQKGRLEILKIHTRNMPLTKDVDLNWLASITYGFVGADLEALAKEAAMSALRRNLPAISWKKAELPPKVFEKLKVTKRDFDNARKIVEPSAMREVLIEVPKVKWSDVGGLEEVKGLLKESVQWPLSNPQAFKRLGIRPPSGILLYGPPGSGKTLLAKAVATESGANFISIKGPEVFNMFVGESEKKVREIFRRAKQVAPAIIFFDEVDALAPRRGLEPGTRVSENVVSQILTEMSGLEDLHNVIVIAATNRPDILDPALLRPGRFDRQILVPAPDRKAREEILKIHTSGMPLKGVNIKEIARKAEDYSGADLEALAREAGLNALRKNMQSKEVGKKDFSEALKKVRPSVNPRVVEFYDKVAQAFSSVKPKKKEERENYIG